MARRTGFRPAPINGRRKRPQGLNAEEGKLPGETIQGAPATGRARSARAVVGSLEDSVCTGGPNDECF